MSTINDEQRRIDAQGPRSALLSGEKRARFISALRPFNDQKVHVRVCVEAWSTDEVRQLVKLLNSTFKEAGWDALGLNTGTNSMACHSSGIWVGLNSEAKSPKRAKDAEKSLMLAFRAIPLAVLQQPDFNSDPREFVDPKMSDPGTIVVVVLLHPI
jgi:hypothetical protein